MYVQPYIFLFYDLAVSPRVERKLSFFPNIWTRKESFNTRKPYFLPFDSTQLNCQPPTIELLGALLVIETRNDDTFTGRRTRINICIRFGPFVDFECDSGHHCATFGLTEGVLAPLFNGGANRPENIYTWRGLIPVVGRRRGGLALPIFPTVKKVLVVS